MHITDTHENRKNNEKGEGRGEKHLETVSHITRLTLNQMSSLARAQSDWHTKSQCSGHGCEEDALLRQLSAWSWLITTARLVSGLSVLEGGACHKREP